MSAQLGVNIELSVLTPGPQSSSLSPCLVPASPPPAYSIRMSLSLLMLHSLLSFGLEDLWFFPPIHFHLSASLFLSFYLQVSVSSSSVWLLNSAASLPAVGETPGVPSPSGPRQEQQWGSWTCQLLWKEG